MQELKSRVLEVVNQINQDWVKELKEAEENKTGFDATKIMGHFSESMSKLDQYFREAEQRLGGKIKKKGLF